MKSFGLKNFSAVKRFQDGTGHKDALYKTIKRKISGSRVRGSIVFYKAWHPIKDDDDDHQGWSSSPWHPRIKDDHRQILQKKRPRSWTPAHRTWVTKLRFSTQILKFLKIKKSPRSCTRTSAHRMMSDKTFSESEMFWTRIGSCWPRMHRIWKLGGRSTLDISKVRNRVENLPGQLLTSPISAHPSSHCAPAAWPGQRELVICFWSLRWKRSAALFLLLQLLAAHKL